MIAAWMLRALALSLLLYVAARVAERGLRGLRWPLRFVWAAALAATAAIAFAASFRHPQVFEKVVVTSMRVNGGTVPVRATAQYRGHPIAGTRWMVPTIALPAQVARFDRPLLVLWTGASLLWGLVLALSALRLHRARRRWRHAELDGASVYLSRDTGPALVGVFRCGIVVPSWVLQLDHRERALIVAHEREHARARDPLLLLGGALAVLALPWNPFVWAMFQRLRFAVESDCDGRVLAQQRDVRGYGELLLLVGERMVARPLPLVALSESRSQLGRRISMMTERASSRGGWTLAGLLALGAAIAVAGCEMPMPLVAPHEPRVDVVSSSDHAIVTLTNVDFSRVGATPWVRLLSHGDGRVSLDGGPWLPMRDTIRVLGLHHASFDVTSGDAHVELEKAGEIQLKAKVTGAAALGFGATGQHIVFWRGGNGISEHEQGDPEPDAGN